MRKIVFTFLSATFLCGTVFSQLSTRENEATTLKLGSRPGAGDMALTFGLGVTGGGVADLPIVNQLVSGDILTFKSYTSSDMAFRLGVKLYKEATTDKGDLIDNAGGALETDLYKHLTREFILAPGIEKHFSKSNIFDVYAGSDLYLGFKRHFDNSEVEYDNGDYARSKMTSNPLVLGLGGVVGVNVFIGQLPVSLGLEYGLNMKWTNEGKMKVKEEYSVGGVTDSQTYYVYSNDVYGQRYSKLKTSDTEINTNSNVRIVLNIYFGK
jgi:hypothetical protein